MKKKKNKNKTKRNTEENQENQLIEDTRVESKKRDQNT